jgi:hypothetical protein
MTDRNRRARADRALRLLHGRGFDEMLTDAERELDKLDPAFAETAASLRAATDADAPRIAPHGGVLAKSVLEDCKALESMRARFDDGEAEAVLHAITFAITHSLPVPAWAGDAFVERMRRYFAGTDGVSLDSLFAAPATTRKRARRVTDWRTAAELWAGVARRIGAGEARSLDAALRRELAARRWGVGLTRARELVEAVERVQRPVIGGRPLGKFSRKRAKTRKR